MPQEKIKSLLKLVTFFPSVQGTKLEMYLRNVYQELLVLGLNIDNSTLLLLTAVQGGHPALHIPNCLAGGVDFLDGAWRWGAL